MIASDIERLIQLLARLPGLGPRSARRAVLHLMKKREALMLPLAAAMAQAAETIAICTNCGNLDTHDPCSICRDSRRDRKLLCVVEDVADLWALERSGAFKGGYHVLGGTLSAIDGRGPEQLNMARLIDRAEHGDAAVGSGTSDAPAVKVEEVILALSATVDGQTTAHYIAERMAETGIRLSRLAHGVPVGGELDYLDDGTLTAAMKARRPA
ncbi:recombination protein RecR [Pelagibius litoralis]|uniref:Recombination protein RecR n=1 Tax=Pelagibius litoralis TaxID=374515 RepID=A0A967KD97_9PROT|nr:recombination mediator RecR [Pelagibius litoralis]NIA71294.1 recombination protein RecR [Pelagibius litoralis]